MVKLIPINQVCQMVGDKSPATIWRWVKESKFPAPIRTGGNSVAWRSDQLQEWIESRPAYKPAPHVTPKRGGR